jgi:hypothetical protein
MTNNKDNKPLVILRYPGQRAGESSYAVIKPSVDDSDVYEVASSWFDDVQRAKRELATMRQRRGER